jgi:putative peptidoglycan lipid II flippase
MRILLIGLLIFSVSGLALGILQAQQRFFSPMLAPIVYELGILFGAVVLKRYGVYGIAIGAVTGAALHLGVQIPGLLMTGFRWRPILDWKDSALRQVIILMIPRAIGLGLANVNLLIAYSFASRISTGAAAAFNWGYNLMQLPQTLIGTAMGIVIFPSLALLSAAGDLSGKRSTLSGGLRFILIATFPAAIVMILLGRPLIGILEGGTFDAEGADRVYHVVQFFALALITQSAIEVVARGFYADKDMVTPLFAALAAAIVNVVVSLAVMPVLNESGLALANGLATGTELVLLTILLRRRWSGLDDSTLIGSTLKAAIAALAMGGVIVILSLILHTAEAGKIGGLIRAVIELIIGVGVYIGVALALKMDEIRALPNLILRRNAG